MPNWYHDGHRFWRLAGDRHTVNTVDGGGSVSEIDPITGKVIRSSVPPFFEESLPSGASIFWHLSHLLPKPSQPGLSPLGEKDGYLAYDVFVDEMVPWNPRDRWTQLDFFEGGTTLTRFASRRGNHQQASSDSYWIVANVEA